MSGAERRGPDSRAGVGVRIEAHEVLIGSASRVLASGGSVPCLGPAGASWTADCADEQRSAAVACRGCLVLEACAAYVAAFPEPAGVWAGSTAGDRVEARRRARAVSS